MNIIKCILSSWTFAGLVTELSDFAMKYCATSISVTMSVAEKQGLHNQKKQSLRGQITEFRKN